MIGISGELEQQTWNDQQGQKKSKVIIKMQNFTFIDKRDNQPQQSCQAPQQQYNQPPQQQQQSYQASQQPQTGMNSPVQHQQVQQYQQPQNQNNGYTNSQNR